MSYASVILADNPVAYWPMNETSGNITDATGNGHTGTVNGSPTYAQPGKVFPVSNAIQFDGTSADFSVADAAALRLFTNDASVELWFNSSTIATVQRLVGKMNTGTNNPQPFSIFLQSSKVRFVTGDNSNLFALSNNTTLTSNTWFHTVAVLSGTTFTWFINNVADGVSASGVNGGSTATPPIIVGANETPGQFFKGLMQHVALYNFALSIPQINTHFFAGLNGQITGTPFMGFSKT